MNDVPQDTPQEPEGQDQTPQQPEQPIQQPATGQNGVPQFQGQQGYYNQAPPPPPPPGGYRQAAYYPQPPVPQQPRKSKWWIPVLIVVGCLFLFFISIVVIGGIMVGMVGENTVSERGAHVALIRIDGVITAGTSGNSLFGDSVSGSEDLVAQLEKARRNKDAKAIVIRINSPGGSPAGSEEVYNEIKRVRDDGKLVYVSMGDVAASGGYYIASPCTKIYCDANTITGSIGVIFHTADMSELYRKIGYKPEVVKSGKFKDIGSSDRPITPEERQLLQGIINSTYINFVGAVAKGRNLPFNQVKKIADGRIFTGDQAKKLKLVDEIGGLHETVQVAAREGGITGTPKVVEYGRKGFLESVFGGESSKASSQLEGEAAKQALRLLLSREQGMQLPR